MKLYSMYFICKSVEEELKKGFEVAETTNSMVIIRNWGRYKNILEALRQLPFLTSYADNIYELPESFIRDRGQMTISRDKLQEMKRSHNEFYVRVKTVIELYESMGLQKRNSGFDVKIPQCTLKGFQECLKELEFIFTQCPYLLSETEIIKFDSLDVGSSWLSFVIEVIAGAAATNYILGNLAVLIDKAIAIKSHLISLKEQEERLRISRGKSELASEVVEMYKELKQSYIKQAADEMAEEIGPVIDGEERGKVEKSIEKMSNLLEKGVEIYASLDASKEIQLLFPPLGETSKLPEEVLKLIEDRMGKQE